MSLRFVLPCSWFFFSLVLPHRFASACHFASAIILHVVRNAASAHHSFFVVLFAAAAFVFFIEASQTQWHVSINIAMFGSASSLSIQIFVFSRVVFIVVVFTPHARWKVSVNLFELLPAASFTCAPVASLMSLCCRVYLTTRSLSLHPCVFVPSLDCSQSLR